MRRRLRSWTYRLIGLVPPRVRQPFVRLLKPSYTLGAMCVIDGRRGELLLVRHAYRQGWGLPGGLVNRREGPAAAVVREVREEIGLDVTLSGPPVIVVDPTRQAVDFVFVAHHDGEAPVPASAEILDLRWFPSDALPELQFEVVAALDAVESAATAGSTVLVVDRLR